MTIKHGFFALGVIVTFAVLWQRSVGTILVSLPIAVLILGLVAGVVAGVVNFMTVRAAAVEAGQN
jgi:ABC-type branched-subunit amino acid transport system permease subunit